MLLLSTNYKCFESFDPLVVKAKFPEHVVLHLFQLVTPALNMKVDYLIIHQEDSCMCYKRGWPGQKPYLLIFVRYEEAQRSWEQV